MSTAIASYNNSGASGLSWFIRPHKKHAALIDLCLPAPPSDQRHFYMVPAKEHSNTVLFHKGDGFKLVLPRLFGRICVTAFHPLMEDTNTLWGNLSKVEKKNCFVLSEVCCMVIKCGTSTSRNKGDGVLKGSEFLQLQDAGCSWQFSREIAIFSGQLRGACSSH